MTERKIFVAGSTGAVGRQFVAQADRRGIAVVPHVRPKRAGEKGLHPKAVLFDLADEPALASAMAGCTTVVQLIGTMRNRFQAGDTYQSSDIGSTASLISAARLSGSVDHFVLLSSVGAGRPMGAYLKAKAKAEEMVRSSGIPFTIFRPSFFIGEGRNPPPGAGVLSGLLGRRYRPIRVEDLAAALLTVSVRRAPLGAALEGGSLWEIVEATPS